MLSWESKNGIATVEKGKEVPQKVKNKITL